MCTIYCALIGLGGFLFLRFFLCLCSSLCGSLGHIRCWFLTTYFWCFWPPQACRSAAIAIVYFWNFGVLCGGGYGNLNLISIARCLRAASSWRRSGMSLYLSSFACMTAFPRSRALVSCVRLRLCSPHLTSALWKPSRCRCVVGQSFRTC